MQGPIDPKRNVPLIDLGTVRDTLAYIRDDLQRVPGLECAAELIASALAEVVAAERRRSGADPTLSAGDPPVAAAQALSSMH